MATRINRRTCLKGLTYGAAAATLGGSSRTRLRAAEGGGSRATLDLLLNEQIREPDGKPAIVSPLLHGHFTEHIGGVVYDGIWVGPDSKVANVDGIRKALVDSFKKLAPPVVRWPGGCFADRYHWRDGIGPAASRPRRFNRWSERTEPNAFGTHEFMRFCRLVGAEPYLAANVGAGTVEEFQQWVEYCNAPAGSTTLADERVANGDRDPFKVRLWGVGNENWGCGGTFTPEDYCTEYRKFTTWPPKYGVPLYLVACGPNGGDVSWTRRFLKKWRDAATAPLNGLSGHYYCGSSGTATQFSTAQWYDLIDKANYMETFIKDHWAAMGEFDPKHEIKLIVDEWGCWHPSGTEIKKEFDYCQVSTLRDAMVAGLTLDTFHRHAEKLSLCAVAQLVNNLHSLFLATDDKFVETTNYHVFSMYRDHQNGTAVPIRVAADPVAFSLDGKDRKIFRVAGSASVRDRHVTLTLTHTHASEPIEIEVRLAGGTRVGEIIGTVLTHNKLNAANTFETPAEVVPRDLPINKPKPDGSLVVMLPPASITRLRIALA
jgi:alpha-L-arabinofuranosidase